MTAEIHVLPGIERRDLGEPAPDAGVLAAALERGVHDVVVVGRDRAGELYIAAAGGDVDRVVGQLMRAVQQLAAMRLDASTSAHASTSAQHHAAEAAGETDPAA